MSDEKPRSAAIRAMYSTGLSVDGVRVVGNNTDIVQAFASRDITVRNVVKFGTGDGVVAAHVVGLVAEDITLIEELPSDVAEDLTRSLKSDDKAGFFSRVSEKLPAEKVAALMDIYDRLKSGLSDWL